MNIKPLCNDANLRVAFARIRLKWVRPKPTKWTY